MESMLEKKPRAGNAETADLSSGLGAEKSQKPPRCASVAERGIRTASDLCTYLSLCIADVATGRMCPGAANATVNAAGKILKASELVIKHGHLAGKRDLNLAELPEEDS